MPRGKSPKPKDLKHHWYLVEWAEQSVPKKTQADAQRELGWNKSTASDLWNGKQRYNQQYVDEAALWLNIKPYELLMHPDEAMAIRRLRAAALTIAAETQPPEAATAPEGEATTPAPARRRASGSR